MHYFDSPQYRAVRRAVKTHFPEITIIEKKDIFDADAVGFAKKAGVASEKTFSVPYREFSVKNNHLLFGAAQADPFSWDELNKLIYETEKNMEEIKQRNYNLNTRSTIEKARNLLDQNLKVKKDPKTGNIDFEVEKDEEVRQYRFIPAEHKNKHLIKLNGENFEESEQVKLFLLPSLLRFKLIRTLYPGLKPEAVDIIAGIDEKNKDPEIPYMRAEHKELYEAFSLRPLDIVYDVYDIFRVGEFADFPARILCLTNGRVYAWRNVLDVLGREKREVVEFEKYEGKKEEIINAYKNQLLEVFDATGLNPSDAIFYLNSRTDGSFLFKTTSEAVENIRIEQLNDPLFLFKKRTRRLISYDADSELSIGFMCKSDKETVVILKYRKYTVKLTVDLLSASISKKETLLRGKEIEKIPNRLVTVSEKIEKILEANKNTVGYKKFLFDKKDFIEFEKYESKDGTVFAIYKAKDEDVQLSVDFFAGTLKLSGGTSETLKAISEKLRG